MTKRTNVSYDTSLKVLTLNRSAWNAVAPLQWFDSYKIISLVENPLAKKMNIIPLQKYFPKGARLPATNKEIRTSPQVARLIHDEHLEDYWHFYNYSLPQDADEKALANDSRVAAKFENKVWLRETFGDTLRFPPFFITSLDMLRKMSITDCLEKLGAASLVIQHPTQTGGRGTYHAATQRDFDSCVQSLADSLRSSDKLVVSQALSMPQERTIQACVANGSVFVGPAQAQLVGQPSLVSSRRGDIQFCGGRIDTGLMNDTQYKLASQAAQIVGGRLKDEGYKGIFGMDFLVSNGELYLLEVNPRLTGLSTLLAFIQHDVPFLLLHILEHAGEAYHIDPQVTITDSSGSYVQVYAQQPSKITFVTGRYSSAGERLGDGFENGSIIPDDPNEFFVGMRVSPGDDVKQAKSLAFIYSRRQLFDDNGTIDPTVIPLVNKIRQ